MALHLRQIVLDAENARELAAFYLALLGGAYRPGDEPAADGSDDGAGWVAIRTSESDPHLRKSESHSATGG